MNTQTQKRRRRRGERRRSPRGQRSPQQEQPQASQNDPATHSQSNSDDTFLAEVKRLLESLEFVDDYIDWLDRHKPGWRRKGMFRGF